MKDETTPLEDMRKVDAQTRILGKIRQVQDRINADTVILNNLKVELADLLMPADLMGTSHTPRHTRPYVSAGSGAPPKGEQSFDNITRELLSDGQPRIQAEIQEYAASKGYVPDSANPKRAVYNRLRKMLEAGKLVYDDRRRQWSLPHA